MFTQDTKWIQMLQAMRTKLQAQIWIFLTSLIRLKKKHRALGQITFRCKARKRSSEVVFVASACVESVLKYFKVNKKSAAPHGSTCFIESGCEMCDQCSL